MTLRLFALILALALCGCAHADYFPGFHQQTPATGTPNVAEWHF
jgi:hypothetical protein